nr:MAG TPA: hypothetical protein [Caudoviricetes sp.]
MTPSSDINVFYHKQVLIGDKTEQSLMSSRFELVSVRFGVTLTPSKV